MVENMRVLLVEDNIADAVYFQKELALPALDYDVNEFVVKVCHTITEALQAIDSGEYDIILLDLKLPDAEKLDGLKEIIEYSKNRIPIVVYSGGLYSSEVAREAIAIGAQDYIIKGTIGKTELVRTLLHAKIRHKWFMNIEKLKGANGDYKGL